MTTRNERVPEIVRAKIADASAAESWARTGIADCLKATDKHFQATDVRHIIRLLLAVLRNSFG